MTDAAPDIIPINRFSFWSGFIAAGIMILLILALSGRRGSVPVVPLSTPVVSEQVDGATLVYRF
jgi:hypothetical protein